MLFNVSYTNDMPEREEKGMLEGMAEFGLSRGTVLTKDYYAKKEVDKKIIDYVPVWAWLLLNNTQPFRKITSF